VNLKKCEYKIVFMPLTKYITKYITVSLEKK